MGKFKKMHRLEPWIKENKLKKKEVATMLGINHSYLSAILNFRRYPSKMLAVKIDKLTGGEVRWHEILFPSFVKVVNVDESVFREGLEK